jgi:hypothetical protein
MLGKTLVRVSQPKRVLPGRILSGMVNICIDFATLTRLISVVVKLVVDTKNKLKYSVAPIAFEED